ncbi:MAG: hypothetical protein C3F18_11210 [Nitrosomonadales bacterium]|nr:MAG: hypothetical protein C3F18_11210 [Nitrosomonadales bacterium]
MIKLPNAIKAWNTPDFENVLKAEVQKIDVELLPLQQGLSQSSYVTDGGISVVILGVTETTEAIRAKTGIVYAGIIAGSCCADDPTPVCEQTEYCEVQFDIDKRTGEATASLLKDSV